MPVKRAQNKRLTILTEDEKFALYALPDFNEKHQFEYFDFSNDELKIISSCSSLINQVYCALQMGYFKAKHMFFNFEWDEIPKEDIEFIINSYFFNQNFTPQKISQYEHYKQVNKIASFYEYQLWSSKYEEELYMNVIKACRIDINTPFVLAEILQFLNAKKIIRPGYTKLQDIISKAYNEERGRINSIILNSLTPETKDILDELLKKNDLQYYLSILKQDAKNFGYKIMKNERQKSSIIKPLYTLVKSLIPNLNISKQNLFHYADLINFYTVFELRELKGYDAYLYLLCYCWKRYLQYTENLINSFEYHLKRFEKETKQIVVDRILKNIRSQKVNSVTIGNLLKLFIDSDVSDDLFFGDIRKNYVFPIIEKDELLSTVEHLIYKPLSELDLKWQAIDSINYKFKKHLRATFLSLDIDTNSSKTHWIGAVNKLKQVLSAQKSIEILHKEDILVNIVPKKLKKYLFKFDEDGNITGINATRYEFWIYRQVTKKINSGEFYLDDSINYRCLEHELVSLVDENNYLKKLDLECFEIPIEEQLDKLSLELKNEWRLFNRAIKNNELKHIQYDKQKKTVTFHKEKVEKDDAPQHRFYEKIPIVDNIDLLRFVNEKTDFLNAFTPIQPRYTKQPADDDALLAVLISQAMNHGKLKLSKISDIPFHILDYTYLQYFRKNNLKMANDIISNAIAKLPIFKYFSYADILYGSVDGQKFGVKHTTTKARHSKKHFGRGKGVVSYTMLINHIPIQNELIGAHEHESYYVFDIYYNNTTDINPDVITGDMHSVNKANFIILHWFNTDFRPRFANLQAQLKHLYCFDSIENYKNYLIKPVGEINRELIVEEWEPRVKQIILTLAAKETTQSKIIKKLCTYNENRTLKAIFELDKIKRSIYTLGAQPQPPEIYGQKL